MFCEQLAWEICHPADMWIFDKLLLSKHLGYVCGPTGLDVPTPGRYIVRPCVNPFGMGRDAQIVHLHDTTDHLPPGHFWCEVFEGEHHSVDYVNREQVLCVEGFRESEAPLYKWSKWKKVDKKIKLPLLCYHFKKDYPHINCEFIGDNLIEMHLRLNPDFRDDVQEVIPVWFGESVTPPEGMKFVEYREYRRKGIFVR